MKVRNKMNTQQNKGKLTLAGVKLASAMLKAESTKRDLLIKLASDYSEEAEYSIILDAYQNELIHNGVSENSAKVRKSEALQVIKAVNLSDNKEATIDALQNVRGEYHAVIEKAREIMQAIKGKTVRTPKVKTELSNHQAESVSNNLQVASANQLQAIVSEATSVINTKVAPAMAGLQQLILISNIANNIMSNDDIEAPIKESAQKILAISEAQILEIQNVMKATQEAINNQPVTTE